MNMLCDPVPDSLSIAGTEYKINTDFRVWVKFEMLLLGEVGDSDNADELLNNIKHTIFGKNMPPAAADEATTEQILWFYRCGKDLQKSTSSKSQKAVFSYNYDDGYIYAAFLQQYRIDLNEENRHWWKFRALMQGLSDDTEFVKILGYRSIEINSKMSAEQRNFYTKMKKLYALPLPKALEEKYDAIEDALINGNSIDDLV